MRCEWDPVKDEINRRKHGISFKQSSELFTGGADYLELYDEEHSGEEDRFIAIGAIRLGVVLVVFTERNEDSIRIVSARRATRRERGLFERYLVTKNER